MANLEKHGTPPSASPTANGGLQKEVTTPLDLNAKIEELRKSEERYHKMIEEVEDYAILLLDADGIILNWNKGAEKIKGYSEDEIVGKSFSTFYLEEDRKKNLPWQLLEEARKAGKATHEGWRCRKDGTSFWGSVVITALHDKDNNVVGFSKVTRDLTERKKAEDQLRQYSSQLEFQNKELEQFAYAASHDMKEPLRKISFYSQYVVENAPADLDDKLKDYLQRCTSAAKRLTNLIDDLLAYSQTNLSSDNGFEETDLNAIVEEITLMHIDVVEQQLVSFRVQPLPRIWAIPFQFKQLLDNLINNAIKYRHPDRMCLISISSQVVSGKEIKNEQAQADTQYHKISVADNGLGFDEQYADKIFELFQRITNASGYKGSGMGLAICKRIAQNHQGFIEASGIENEGATFDVFVPVKRQ